MFDFHVHTKISYDCKADPLEMAKAAAAAGLREICFTDHMDYTPWLSPQPQQFSMTDYQEAYDNLSVPGLEIRRGIELGLIPDCKEDVTQTLAQRPFDFVIGSIHFARQEDVYRPPYWKDRTIFEGEERYFQEVLTCVQNNDDFDVLGHLTYPCKGKPGFQLPPIPYEKHRDLVDEIMRTLVAKGKGMELNTSGLDRCGVFLPDKAYFLRFRELGGEIVTVGSDAHNTDRVGQYTREACALLQDIFGYVCTFQNRKPIFHKA